MTLILDLSSKVTEQQTEIIRLREQLCKHNLSTDAAGTSTEHSTVDESSWKCLDTGWRQRLHSPSHQSVDTNAVVGDGISEESSNRLRFDGQSTQPISKAAIARNNFSLGRTSQGSVDSYFKYSSKQEKNPASYRTHWASSCFDIDDLGNVDDTDIDSKAAVLDDRDCGKVTSDVPTSGTKRPSSLGKDSASRTRHRRRNTRVESEQQRSTKHVDQSRGRKPPVCK